jgi:hypothetical protein
MRPLEAFAFGAWNVLAVLVALLPDLHPALRITLVLPLIVFLPGYALVRAFQPHDRTGVLEIVTLALGLSLSLSAVGAIFLHLTPAGIQASTWLALLVSISAAAGVISVLRRLRQPRRLGQPAEIPRSTPRRRGFWLRSFLQAGAFGLALVIVVAAFAVAIAGVDAQPRPGFAQLWLLTTDDPAVVTLGVRNEDGGPISVQVRLTRDSNVEAEWKDITLSNDASWTTVVSVPDFAAGSTPLEATLSFMASPDVIYRHVTLWPPST